MLFLTKEEQKIAKLASDIKDDTTLSPEVRKTLTNMLNGTSYVVYPEKEPHLLNKALLAKLSGSDFTPQDAQELCAQMQRVYQLKLCLGQDMGFTDAERAQLTAEYDTLNAILHQ